MPLSRSARSNLPCRCLAAAAVLAMACAPAPAEVSPAEIPELRERVAQRPADGELTLRLSAALFAANRCDTAVTVARTGMALRPSDAVGPLVVGQCQERAAAYGEAIGTYDAFLAGHPDGRGVGAVRARRLLADRARATQGARLALQRETELTPADPSIVAVLPVLISGDSSYQPLSRGLAQILTSDLALLERFRMVERLQLAALLEEMQLSQNARFDPQTTARVGLLVQAGRLVQGLAVIPGEDDVRLETSVVLNDGQVTAPEAVTGRLRDLLRLEKDLVVRIAGQLGYQLSEAEERAIRENGTQNLVAFLAYSRGLVAEDAGDYSAAAVHFGQATQADPGFQAARSGYQANTAAPAAQDASPTQVTTVAAEEVRAPEVPVEDPTAGALNSGVTDVAATQSEATATQTTQTSTQTTASQPPPPPVTPPQTVTGTIRIIFRLP